MEDKTLVEGLIEKWAPLLESEELPAIGDSYRKSVTAILLENEEKALAEASPANIAAGVANWDPILMGMVRRAMPQLIAFDIAGVQPMTGPTGLIFALKSRYLAAGTDSGKNTTNQTEALWNEANGGYAGTGAFAGYIGSQFLSITTTNADATVTTADTSSIAVGMPVVATGVPTGATVLSITNGTTFELSANATAGGTVTATFGMGNSLGTVDGLTTAVGEGDITAKMGFTIEKSSVEAKTYQLATGYSIELAQDMRAIHGLDAESELTNILSGELIAEQNRTVLRRLYTVAKAGAQSGVNNAGIFDLATDSDGRWSNERFKGLIFAIERDANRIALDIRLGKGNILVCSADVASALAAAGTLDYAPALAGLDALNADFTTNTFVGVMSGGRMKVFVDPYASGDFYMVGYKGSSAYAAGYFYCPYVAAQMLRATDPASFQPLIGLKMRYGQTFNPMSGSASFRQNGFYRIAAVTNVLS
jgi:hypothetical protein